MKHFKMSMMLLVTVAIFTSCEKETINEFDLQNLNEDTLSENMEAGYGVGSLTDLYSKQLSNSSNKSLIELEGYTLYYDDELFNETDCDVFAIEGFENIIPFEEYGARFLGPLNASTNNQYFTPGSIVPGLEFDSPGNLVVFDVNSWFTHPSKALGSNSYNSPLIIDITSNSITSIGMELFTYYYSTNQNVQVDIYDDNGELTSTSYATASSGDGVFWGVKSNNPIKRIILTSINDNSWVGIDNISYGACGDDYDNDGVLNEDDPYPYSNMSEYVSIDGCEPNIDNVFSDEGTTMMDEIDALVAEINAQYDGENYDELHSDFTRGISKITYYWRKDRLITRGERSDISSCAWRANIPYFNEPR